MSRRHSGFTLIEVSLFLAITGILFVGIAVGTQNSIFQQRFNDSVQSFAEYLRSAYSDVTNVRNDGNGRSDKAIYGKLITFGENTDLAGNEIGSGTAIFSYNVIADAEGGGTGDALSILSNLGATVVVKDDESSGYKPAGFADDYKPRWSAAIQMPAGAGEDAKKSFVGALLIVRHPDSGTVYTYVMEGDTIQVNAAVKNQTSSIGNLLKDALESKKFETKAVDFCVNPSGIGQGGLRRDVRLVNNARNGSGVEVIGDGDGDKCGRVD